MIARSVRVVLATGGIALMAASCGGGGGGSDASSTTTARTAPSTTTPSTTAARHGVQATTAPWKLPAPVAREIVVADGKQFEVVGGLDATKFSTASVVVIDPSSGASQAPSKLGEAVHDAAGARIGDKVLVFGGGGPSENGTADVQSVPASGTASIVATMPQSRSDHVAATVGTKTYVLGGYDGANIVAGVLSTSDGVTFTSVGNLPVPVRYPAVAVVGKAVYLFGGVENSAAGIDTKAVQKLDTATGAITNVGQLPTSLSHASAVVLGNMVYLLGGYVNNTTLSDQILRFDPATGTATVVGRLPAALSDGAAVVIGSTGYLVGGQGTDRNPVATVTVVTAG